MSKISLNRVHKKYDENSDYSVYDFSMDIEENEFVVFVGPSGCGKSTTLRMIAGLESVSAGEIYIDSKIVNDVPPKDRGTAMVFQNYALYPHLSVYDNIGFGLKIRGVEKQERDNAIKETAEMLSLTPYLNRKPKELSGGQKQRVALGRAIVKKSDIFLMDEPLSNLDAKLRVQMREEIVRLQRELKSTTVYVTHDQTEAMTMASKIVCLKDGIVQQIGTPVELYKNPKNLFVATFLGSPHMNVLKGKIEDGKCYTQRGNMLSDIKGTKSGDITVGIRPESIKISDKDTGLKFNVRFVDLLGADYHVHGDLDGNKMILKIDSNIRIQDGEVLNIQVSEHDIMYFDKETEERIASGGEEFYG